jgi:hypothetical protein
MLNASTSAETATATQATAIVFLDGEPINIRAYNINGHNYFMLRELGQYLGFYTDWSELRQTIHLITSIDDPRGSGRSIGSLMYGDVRLVVNGVEHEPQVHFVHGATRYTSMSGVGILRSMLGDMPKIPFANDMQIIIDVENVDFRELNVSLEDGDGWELIIRQESLDFSLPYEAGVYILFVEVVWRNNHTNWFGFSHHMYTFRIVK